jgi:DNA-binding transcriptional LysR family regulator
MLPEPSGEGKHLLARDLHSGAVNVELRHLRYFVAVAEELHFTRAARRLHIAQQPLSAAIARLEQQLGVTLLARTTRRVELTEAGAALLEPARAALQAVEQALAAARAAGRGDVGELLVGLSSGAWYGLEPLFDAVRERHSGLRLHVRQQSTRPLLDDVRAGHLDVAVGLCVQDPGELAVQRLKDQPVLLAVPAGHRLAARAHVEVAELRGETLALDDPSDGPDYNAAVLAVCARGGLAPRTREYATHHDAWQNAILHDGCVGLTVNSAIHSAHRDMHLIALQPPATFPLDLLWRPTPAEPLKPALSAFIEVAADVTRREAWATSTAVQAP